MAPKVNTKIITQHAYDTIRYLNTNDVRAERTYQKFLLAGQKAPGYARLKLIEAINDPSTSAKNCTKPIKRSEKNGSENWSLSTKIHALTRKFPFEQMLFDSEYRAMYPNTFYKRKAVESYFENFCLNTSKLKTSRMKWYKKLLTFWNDVSD